MECVNQLRRRLFPASEPENYIVHNLRTSLSVAGISAIPLWTA